MSVVKPIPLVATTYLGPDLRTYVGKEYGTLAVRIYKCEGCKVWVRVQPLQEEISLRTYTKS
jgi:hypothetical protein